MKKIVATTFIAVGSFAAAAIVQAQPPVSTPAPLADKAQVAAAEQWPPKVEEALQHHYAGYEHKLTGTREINGITVFDFEIHGREGDAAAAITKHGDFLVAGVPSNHLTPPVRAVFDHLFKSPPQDVDRFVVTVYTADIVAHGVTQRVIFDALGRVREIKSAGVLSSEGAYFDRNNEDGDRDRHRKVEEIIQKTYGQRFPVSHMWSLQGVENFDNVEYRGANGEVVEIVTNGNDIFSRKVEVKENELPAPVARTIHEMFQTDRIQSLHRRTFDYYQFDVTAPDGDILTMKVACDGVVLNVLTHNGAKDEDDLARHHHELQVSRRPGGAQ